MQRRPDQMSLFSKTFNSYSLRKIMFYEMKFTFEI